MRALSAWLLAVVIVFGIPGAVVVDYKLDQAFTDTTQTWPRYCPYRPPEWAMHEGCAAPKGSALARFLTSFD